MAKCRDLGMRGEPWFPKDHIVQERLSDGNKKWQGCLIQISIHRKLINATKDTA